jgi:hypothetical protein
MPATIRQDARDFAALRRPLFCAEPTNKLCGVGPRPIQERARRPDSAPNPEISVLLRLGPIGHFRLPDRRARRGLARSRRAMSSSDSNVDSQKEVYLFHPFRRLSQGLDAEAAVPARCILPLLD